MVCFGLPVWLVVLCRLDVGPVGLCWHSVGSVDFEVVGGLGLTVLRHLFCVEAVYSHLTGLVVFESRTRFNYLTEHGSFELINACLDFGKRLISFRGFVGLLLSVALIYLNFAAAFPLLLKGLLEMSLGLGLLCELSGNLMGGCGVVVVNKNRARVRGNAHHLVHVRRVHRHVSEVRLVHLLKRQKRGRHVHRSLHAAVPVHRLHSLISLSSVHAFHARYLRVRIVVALALWLRWLTLLCERLMIWVASVHPAHGRWGLLRVNEWTARETVGVHVLATVRMFLEFLVV